MSSYKVYPSKLFGEVEVPPSKSQTLRAILFASLASGKSHIDQILSSPDTDAMIAACKLMGAKIEKKGSSLTIEGTGGEISPIADVIHAGNSGIVLRFLTAVCAISSSHTVITGDESIRTQREMTDVLKGLSDWGVSSFSTRQNGLAPVVVRGPLKPGLATISGKDSQHVSALLIAGALSPHTHQLKVTDPGERPWVDLTLSWFDRMNVPYKRKGHSEYTLEGGAFPPFHYRVPSDASTAAFPLAAGWISGGEVSLKNFIDDPHQGDAKALPHVMGETSLRTIDINDYIDALPILTVVACFREGETHLCGAKVARQKECDRIKVMFEELKKMGAQIDEREDGLTISKSALQGAELNSHGDHRVAMALSVAALGAKGPSTLSGTDCISKTYPGFASAFHSLGAKIEEGG